MDLFCQHEYNRLFRVDKGTREQRLCCLRGRSSVEHLEMGNSVLHRYWVPYLWIWCRDLKTYLSYQQSIFVNWIATQSQNPLSQVFWDIAYCACAIYTFFAILVLLVASWRISWTSLMLTVHTWRWTILTHCINISYVEILHTWDRFIQYFQR